LLDSNSKPVWRLVASFGIYHFLRFNTGTKDSGQFQKFCESRALNTVGNLDFRAFLLSIFLGNFFRVFYCESLLLTVTVVTFL